jgi:hypothetical protein
MSFERDPGHVAILDRRIRDFGLRLEGTPLERLVERLYAELQRKGLHRFRPACYLTDEWGCPDRQPVIGIPFYLAHPDLARLEKSMNDLEDERQIMMYLRHEAGHAFNYAYRLYATAEWRRRFGNFYRPYPEDYTPVPFSRRHVRHLAGWYAQKHPDEDFAETFAVWLTPRSGWRRRYRGWPALTKLRYVERIARQLGDVDPPVPTGEVDLTADQMEQTVGEFYRDSADAEAAALDLALESDLADVFVRARRPRAGLRPAAEFVDEHRLALTDHVANWTGVKRPLVRALVARVARTCREQALWVDERRAAQRLVELTALLTALAMNYLHHGRFVHE